MSEGSTNETGLAKNCMVTPGSGNEMPLGPKNTGSDTKTTPTGTLTEPVYRETVAAPTCIIQPQSQLLGKAAA